MTHDDWHAMATSGRGADGLGLRLVDAPPEEETLAEMLVRIAREELGEGLDPSTGSGQGELDERGEPESAGLDKLDRPDELESGGLDKLERPDPAAEPEGTVASRMMAELAFLDE